MANIMITYRCNLRCSYCFANEFVNKKQTDISIRNFLKAVSFITRTGQAQIGLIGGEPTIHPGFQTMMDILIDNPKVSLITLFTNGLFAERYIPQIIHPKVRVLVNCNSPDNIGENAFAFMQNNIDKLIFNHEKKDRVRLGINLYSNDMDYSYILKLLQRYHLHTVRISVTVPDFSTCGEVNVLEQFKKRKDFLWRFFHDLDSIKVIPYSDCNHPPYCIWNEEERNWLEGYVDKYPEYESNLASRQSQCLPAIDILPDLQAVRCFGMSDFMKVSIDDFQDIRDITSYFMNEIDSNAYKISACEECKECYERKTRQCVAGCMGYKASKIKMCNRIIENI